MQTKNGTSHAGVEGLRESVIPGIPATVEQAQVAASLKKIQARLDAIDGQLGQLSWQVKKLQAFRKAPIRQWIRRIVECRLLAVAQYDPRPLSLPARYTRPRPLKSPPVISIVTPSYNQGPFLARTIRSVLEQRYPRLEYMIQDGGSSDETAEVLEQYRAALTHCESAKDRGQAHAINLGFRHASGEILAYLNSDDLLLPGALQYVARYFATHPKVDVVYGHRIVIDGNDGDVGRWILPPHDDRVLPWADFVPQETLFWRRRIWERVGGAMDESFQFALDWDLLLRFRDAGARMVRLPRFLGAFRIHSNQKTCAQFAANGEPEMERLRDRSHGRKISDSEVGSAIRGFLRRHAVYHKLYELGIIRY